MSDDILLKSVSNKRWVKKLYETNPSNKTSPIAKFLLSNFPVFINIDDDFIYLTTWKEQTLDNEYFNNTERNISSLSSFYKNSFFKDISKNDIELINVSKYGRDISSSTSKIGRARLLKRLNINRTNGNTSLSGIICYMTVRKLEEIDDNHINDRNGFNNLIINSLGLKKIANGPKYQYGLGGVWYDILKPYINGDISNQNNKENGSFLSNLISKFKKPQAQNSMEVQTDANLDKDYEYQSTTNGKKEKVKHQKSLQKYTVEIDNLPTEKDEVTMHIKSTSKDKDKALPYLYTSEVVTDERARTYMDVCNMVENNTTKIEDNLLSSSYGKILKYSKSNLGNITNIESNGKHNISKEEKEKLDKEELVYSAASFENKEQIRNISIRICDCYLRAMADAKNKIFKKDYEGSKGLNYNLHLYLIEILSPLVIAACAENCKWTANTEDEGLKAFKDHVGVDESVSDFTTNCYISFPEASNFPLADSVIYINGIRTFISTKGGANGEGAHPAIKTLKEFVYGEDGKTLTYLTEVAKNEYPTEFAVFEELLQGNVSKINFNKIYNLTSCSSVFELKKWIDGKEDIFTKIIMTILQAQSFQFMQVNADSSSFNSDFHFNYRVQYPAVFSGNVSIDFEKNYIKFYIHKA